LPCVIKTHFIHMSYYTEARRTYVNVNAFTSQNQLRTLYDFFFFYRYYYLLYGGNISRARATQLYFMRTKAVATAARAMLLVGKPNEWCLRVRVFYHLDFFYETSPILVHEPRQARAWLWRRVLFFFFKRQ